MLEYVMYTNLWKPDIWRPPMRQLLRKPLSALLALALLCTLALPASASDALGEDLQGHAAAL